MDIMILISSAGALVVGVVLGVLGGGGSILTIPLLVYVLGLPPVDATGYSMFIIGIAAFAGTFGYYRRGWLNIRIALMFIVPSVLAVYLTRHYVMPAFPERFSIDVPDVSYGLGTGLLVLLGIATVFVFRLARPSRKVTGKTGTRQETEKAGGMAAMHRALILAIPAAVTVYVMRRYALPLFPVDGLGTGPVSVSRDLAIMLLLAAVMLATGVAMLRGRDDSTVSGAVPDASRLPLLRLGIQGVVVGILTGTLGAGGGFLITPALVLLAKLPIRVAVGTSLLIVSINSLTGFAGDLHRAAFDWVLLGTLSACALVGVSVGATVSARLPAALLRRGLGWLLTVMAVVILVIELRA